jgi:zinc D-Ala-D-Ala dipeptidase
MRFRHLALPFIVLGIICSCADNSSKQKHSVTKPIAHKRLERQIPSRKSHLEQQFQKAGLVDVCKLDSTIQVDLRYAGKNNFTKITLYDTLTTIYLQPDVARKLIKAQERLKSIDPSLSLIVWDAARPLSIQRKMFEQVAGTVYQKYVASPQRTGLHNYGCAVDLGICRSKDASLLDMGTPFDFFGKQAGISREEEFIEQGILTRQQVENRKLLRRVMSDSGFLTVKGEWWHFNSCRLAKAKQVYRLIP